MATYYVSATTGNDSNNGTSVALAKATIGAGENLATTAGDIVYIAPGTYRESITHGYSGTAANRIYFIGDPDCEKFGTAVEPGVVRITISDADDIGQASGTCVYSGGRDFITWKNVYVDGGTGGITSYNDNNITYGFRGLADSDYMEIINCMAQHVYYGAYRVAYMIDSVLMSYAYGCRDGYQAERCIGAGAYAGFYSVARVDNCVGTGYYPFLYNDETVNSTGFGGITMGRPYNGDYIHDCHGVLNYYGAYGGGNTNSSQNGHISSSVMSMTRYSSNYGYLHGIKITSTQYQWVNNRDPLVGKNASTDMQGDGLLWDRIGLCLWDINDVRKLADVASPRLLNNSLRGFTSVDTDDEAGATDYFGNPRKMGIIQGQYLEGQSGFLTSSRDIGHEEFSTIAISSSISSSGTRHGFTITDEGIFKIPIVVSASSAVTASIGVRHSKGAGNAVKPQFQLRYSETDVTASATSYNTTTAAQEHLSGSDLIIQSVTSTANDNDWETLSVSGSFTKNAELDLVVINQQTGSDSISGFSDLEIT